MYKIIYRTIRPSKNIHFYPRPDNIEKLIHEEKFQGRLLYEYTNFSEDYLIKKYVAVWRDRQCLEEFNRREEVKTFIRKKIDYDQMNGNYTNIIGEYINE